MLPFFCFTFGVFRPVLPVLPPLTFPTTSSSDLLYLQFGIDFAFVRINRLLRVGRMLEFFDRTDSRTNYPHIFRVLQLVIYMIVSIHWNACLYYQISVWIGLGSDEWVCYGVLTTFI